MTYFGKFLSVLTVCQLFSGAALGDVTDKKVVGTFGNGGAWKVFSYKEDGKPVAYAVSEPTKSEGKYTKRGKVLLFVTFRGGRSQRK